MKRLVLALLCVLALHAQAASRRIVTLLPSLTESVCVLGHCDELVGVDDFSDWPAQVAALPRVGGLDDARIEKIVALKPDLVLLAGSTRATGRLKALGVNVVAFEPKTMGDARDTLVRIGELLGERDKAVRALQDVEEGIAAAAASVPAARKGVRVYLEVDSGPYAASPSSHVGELLTRLGAGNIVPASLGTVARLNPEFVVRADPDVIIIPARDAAEMRQRPGWNRIRAVRDGRVCSLGDAEGNMVMRPGPRAAEAARVLARCIAK